LPIYLLGEDPEDFPPPEKADRSGLLAVGGDLRPERLLAAYARGIFPWYSEGQPLLWHSPNPRFVLLPERLHVGRSLRKVLKAGHYTVRWDTAFEDVIDACAQVPRPGQIGTWITPEMREAYVTLHRLGFAHSVEAWAEGELKGGLYGVSLGAAFFGESMFALTPDASKVAFVTSVERMRAWGFHFIDCQVETEHLARFGAEPWPRRRFLQALARALREPTRRGRWTEP
jgi:leucyl/phenylalanyl-tRNA--protein transferase